MRFPNLVFINGTFTLTFVTNINIKSFDELLPYSKKIKKIQRHRYYTDQEKYEFCRKYWLTKKNN